MKTSSRSLLISAVAIASAVCSPLRAQEKSSPPPEVSTVTITGFDPAAQSMSGSGTLTLNTNGPNGAMRLYGFVPKQVKTTYFGVFVVAADSTLQAQLKLPEGVGLAVAGLDNDGPAKGVLQEHDVLYKLGDQLLINYEQFEVLARTHKPGESVEMTIIRAAQPMKVNITPVEKEMPELPYLINSSHARISAPTTSPNMADWEFISRNLADHLTPLPPAPEKAVSEPKAPR